MFTGIVESTGQVEALTPRKDGATKRIVVSTTIPLHTVPLGGSIAVNGVCLTLIGRKGKRFEADLGPETLVRTTLGTLGVGDRVHLERPLRMGDPLGGHLVAGHVDGVGTVKAVRPQGDALTLEIAAPAELAAYLAPKGSLAIDGVSLTVNGVRGRVASVTLIPHTLAVTRLGALRVEDTVNLEMDLLAKHLARMLEARRPSARRRPLRHTRSRKARP